MKTNPMRSFWNSCVSWPNNGTFSEKIRKASAEGGVRGLIESGIAFLPAYFHHETMRHSPPVYGGGDTPPEQSAAVAAHFHLAEPRRGAVRPQR